MVMYSRATQGWSTKYGDSFTAMPKFTRTITMDTRPLIRAPIKSLRREASNCPLSMRHKLWAHIRQEAVSMAVAARDM